MVCWKIHRLASFSYRSFSRRTKTRGFPGHIWKNDRVDAADVCWCASAIPERPLGIRRRSTSTSRTCGEQQWFDQFDPTKMDDLQQICSQFMATRMGKMMINGMKTSKIFHGQVTGRDRWMRSTGPVSLWGSGDWGVARRALRFQKMRWMFRGAAL